MARLLQLPPPRAVRHMHHTHTADQTGEQEMGTSTVAKSLNHRAALTNLGPPFPKTTS